MLAQQSTESMTQQEAPQKKTFFTTLNQPDNQTHRDIKEFINHCENDGEGFNFLQDSEIMSRQQQQEQHNVESTFQTQQQQENAFNTFNPTQGSFWVNFSKLKKLKNILNLRFESERGSSKRQSI